MSTRQDMIDYLSNLPLMVTASRHSQSASSRIAELKAMTDEEYDAAVEAASEKAMQHRSDTRRADDNASYRRDMIDAGRGHLLR